MGSWAWECGSEAGVHSWCGSGAGVHSWDHGPGSVGVRQGFTHGIMGLGVWE